MFRIHALTRVLHAAAVCVSAAVTLSLLATAAPAAELEDLPARFRAVGSIHLDAEVIMTYDPRLAGLEDTPGVGPPGGTDRAGTGPTAGTTTVAGRFEYQADHHRYRVKSQVDPAKLPGMATEFAFDGTRFQFLHADKTLTYSRHDPATVLPGLPNPLFQLLQFLYPLTDETQHLEVRFKDVVSDQALSTFQKAEWTSVEDGGRKLERAEFPGGTYEGEAYVHHVFVVPGERDRPIRIDRVSESRRLTSSEFLDYRPVRTAAGLSWWPHRIVLSAFTATGEAAITASFSLTTLRFDEPLNDSCFEIPTERARRVWDDDMRQLVHAAPDTEEK